MPDGAVVKRKNPLTCMAGERASGYSRHTVPEVQITSCLAFFRRRAQCPCRLCRSRHLRLA
jgi:hypothetical protein